MSSPSAKLWPCLSPPKPGDLAEVEHFMKRVAGAELNVATGLARLGLKVGWVSRVGNDSFGRFVLQSLAKEGDR